jgi:hypothetical protein
MIDDKTLFVHLMVISVTVNQCYLSPVIWKLSR